MKRKAGWIYMLGLIPAILLAGCGVGVKTGAQTETGNPASVQKEEQPVKHGKFRIGMAQCNFSEPWRVVMNRELYKAVEAYPELELTIADGMQDNNKQISDIQGFIEKKYDLIIVSPNEAKPLTAIVKKAYESGVPIILLDRKVEGEYYTQFIGADNRAIGMRAGAWVVRHLGRQGGNVVEIRGSDGTSAQKERHQGFLEGIASQPNIRIIESKNADWLRENSIKVMEPILRNNRKIDVVYGHNDPCAEGAFMAAKSVNREKEMAFVGIDALPTADGGIRSVIDGRLSVTYVYPTGAREAIDSCYRLLVKNEKLQKDLRLNTVEITRNNAREMLSVQNGKM